MSWNFKKIKSSNYIHSEIIEQILYIPDKRVLLTCSDDCMVIIWNLYTGKKIRILNGHHRPVCNLSELEEKKIITTSLDKTIKIWNFFSGEICYELVGHTDWVWTAIEFYKGIIISGSADKTLRVWDLKNKNGNYLIKTVKSNDQGMCTIIRRLNENLIVCGSDENINIYDIKKSLPSLILKGHQKLVLDILIVKVKEQIIISSSYDRTIRIWDGTKGSCLGQLIGHMSAVNQLFRFNKQVIGSCSDDGTIRLWNWEKRTWLANISGNMQKFNTCKAITNKILLCGSSINGRWKISLSIWILAIPKIDVSDQNLISLF